MDQELDAAEVSGPHRNMKRAALQLDTTGRIRGEL